MLHDSCLITHAPLLEYAVGFVYLLRYQAVEFLPKVISDIERIRPSYSSITYYVDEYLVYFSIDIDSYNMLL